MPRRPIVALLACAALAGCGSTAPESTARISNVFVISLDSASARYLDAYGAEPGSTPVLAQLARESVVFENAYSQTATTVSSVASLLTGMRATTHRVEPKTMTPLETPTLVEQLRDHGYRAFGFVANPMAGLPRLGFDRGYEVYQQVYANTRGIPADNPSFAGTPYKLVYPEDMRAELDLLIGEFRPSHTFAYFHYLQPHTPYDPPAPHRRVFGGFEPGSPEWKTLEARIVAADESGEADAELIALAEARYRANLHYADAGVGELLDTLRSAGLYEEALIVVTADHGEAFFGHERFLHNYTLYDDMIRVPLLMKFPRRDGIQARRIANPTETVDLPATLLDYLGLPPDPAGEGVSLWPLIRGDASELERPEVVLSTFKRDQHAIRVGRHKLIVNEKGRAELYDLEADPDELRDLSIVDPITVTTLGRQLAQTLARSEERAARGAGEAWQVDPEMRELLETLGYAEMIPEAEAR